MRYVLAFLALVLAAPAQPSSGRMTIRGGTILNGRGGVLKNLEIVIENGRIRSLGPAHGRPTYDLHGLTVMPGWIDTHVHLNWHFNEAHKNVNGHEDPAVEERATAENARVTLMGGFTTVQSVGAAVDAMVRDRVNRGEIPGPRILTSFRQIQAASGDPDALRALVRKTKQDGADVIKLFATTGLGAGGNQSMSDAQIQAVCSEAKAVGLRSVVHAIGDAGARASALAGCTSIEHGTFLTNETLDLMAAHGTYFDPNLLVLHNYLEDLASFNFTDQVAATLILQSFLDDKAASSR